MDKAFGKKLRALVLPIAFQQFMLAAVSASDAVMPGMLNQDAMAGISLASQVQFVFSLYLAVMTIGASIFAAQYWGNGNRDAVERILGMVLKVTIPISAGLPKRDAGNLRLLLHRKICEQQSCWCDLLCRWGQQIRLSLRRGDPMEHYGSPGTAGDICLEAAGDCGLFFINLDEIIKLPAVYIHFKKYKWVKNLTQPEGGTVT